MVRELQAKVKVDTLVEGSGEVAVSLLDASGRLVAQGSGANASLELEHPHLWDGVRDPYLYTCLVQLQKNGQTVDEVKIPVGIRTFSVDAKKGFFLTADPTRSTVCPVTRTARAWATPSLRRCTKRTWL